jgi:hypothetical protein
MRNNLAALQIYRKICLPVDYWTERRYRNACHRSGRIEPSTDDSDFGGLYACVELKDKTWKCEKVKASANVPPGLTDALNDATGPSANLNDRGVLEDPTTSPQLEQDVGPNEGVLGNLQGNNMTFSRANITAPN